MLTAGPVVGLRGTGTILAIMLSAHLRRTRALLAVRLLLTAWAM